MFRLENITNQIFFSFQTFFTVFIKLQKCCKKYFLSPTTKSSLNFENNFYSVYKDIKRLKREDTRTGMVYQWIFFLFLCRKKKK